MNDLFDKIYVINLKRRRDRLIFMEYKLNVLNIDYQIIEAVDGYSDINKQLFDHLVKNKSVYLTSPGALGIIMTHINILNDALNMNYERILIFEDDILFHNDFYNRLDAYKDVIKSNQYPLIYLGSNQYKWNDEMLESIMTKNHYFGGNKKYYTNGCFAISINKSYYGKILNKIQNLENIRNPIDNLLNDILLENKDKSFVIYPPLIIADVCESDNMGSRDQIEFCEKRKWDLSLYNYITMKSFFDFLQRSPTIIHTVIDNTMSEDTNKFVNTNLNTNTNIIDNLHKTYLDAIMYKIITYTPTNILVAEISRLLKTHNISLRQLLFNYNVCLSINDICSLYRRVKIIDKDLAQNLVHLLFVSTDFNKMKSLIKVIEGFDLAFCFVVPSFNNEKNYTRNLDSIFKQNYDFFRIIYIDDVSTDNTYDLVETYIKKNNLLNKTRLLKQYCNQKQGASRFICYQASYDDEILVMLDGDDWLYDHNVLTTLNETYKKNNLLASYGSFYVYENGKISSSLKGKKKFPEDEIKNKTYRKYDWISQHLRTGYAKLFKNIKINDLLHDDKFYEISTDLAEMFPVLEMADKLHMNIQKPLYVYNKDNSIIYDTSFYNNNKMNNKYNEYRMIVNKKIRTLPPYESINPDEITSFYNNISTIDDKRYDKYEVRCEHNERLLQIKNLEKIIALMIKLDVDVLFFDDRVPNSENITINYITAYDKFDEKDHGNIKIGMFKFKKNMIPLNDVDGIYKNEAYENKKYNIGLCIVE